MKKSLALITIFLLMQIAFSERILEMEMIVYRNDSIDLNRLRVAEGRPSFYIPPGSYRVGILDDNGKKIFEQSYRLDFFISANPPLETNSSILYLKIPYKPEMRELKVYRDDRGILAEKIDLCNDDGVCDIEYETYLSCPDDCPPAGKDGICIKDSDGTCDPDCFPEEDPDCGLGTTTVGELGTTSITETPLPTTTIGPEGGGGGEYIPYLAGIIIIVIAIIVLRSNQIKRMEQKRKEEEERLRKWVEERLRDGEEPGVLKKALEERGADPGMVDEIMRRL